MTIILALGTGFIIGVGFLGFYITRQEQKEILRVNYEKLLQRRIQENIDMNFESEYIRRERTLEKRILEEVKNNYKRK